MRCRLDRVVALFAMLCFPAAARSDDYSRIARLSFIEGHVSFQHPNEVDWTDASMNLALQPGDRIYTKTDGRAEIEFDEGSVLRLAEQTDVEIVSMNESLVQLRVLLGLCTLTRRGKVPFDISTPAASFHTLHAGVYRFDVTETGSSDGIVRKGSMRASAGNYTREVDKGELVHVEMTDQSTPVISRYEGRDAWDEWTDRRTADEVAYASTNYLPDYVYVGVSDLDRYGRWVDIGPYGYGWTPYYVGAGWSPYWDGRWCYRPYWGWTWVSYEPWGWLPYHYGSWYFSAGFGWCWLPGPSFGFHFWSPGLVRFYSGPGWVSWAPLGPGDYYNVHNYWYNPRYSHYVNDMRLIQRRGPEDLANRHVPGAFRSEPTDQFVNGGRMRGGTAGALVAGVNEPWRDGRLMTDRLDVKPTARSYQPAASSRAIAGRTDAAAVPEAERFAGRAGTPGSTVEMPAPAAAGSSRGADGSAQGYASGAVNLPARDALNPGASGSRGRAAQDTADRQIRIWNRVEEPVTGSGGGRTMQSGPATVGAANPRSGGRGVDDRVESVRGAGSAPATYEAPRPTVIERGVAGQSGTASNPASRRDPELRNEARPSPAPAAPPSSQRNDSRGPSGIEERQNGRAYSPGAAVTGTGPASSRPASGSDPGYGGRSNTTGRWQSSGGSAAAAPGPSWGSSGRSQTVRPAGGGSTGWQSPSWGRGASQPAGGGGASRSAPPSGAAGGGRAKNP
jgi:hypothetical protein